MAEPDPRERGLAAMGEGDAAAAAAADVGVVAAVGLAAASTLRRLAGGVRCSTLELARVRAAGGVSALGAKVAAIEVNRARPAPAAAAHLLLPSECRFLRVDASRSSMCYE